MEGVILAAGKGERLRPLTSWLPKFMIPLGGTPVIVHMMNRLHMQGCTKIVLVTSSEGAAFIQPLRTFVPPLFGLEFAICDVPGQVTALRRGLQLTSSDSVWVAFCDNVFDPNLKIENSLAEPFFVSVEDAKLASTGRYGVVSEFAPRIAKTNAGTRIQTGLFFLPRTICALGQGEDLAAIVGGSGIGEHVFASWWRDVGEWDMHLECEILLRDAKDEHGRRVLPKAG